LGKEESLYTCYLNLSTYYLLGSATMSYADGVSISQ